MDWFKSLSASGLLALAAASIAHAQSTTITPDAEYNGALLSSTQQTFLGPQGRVTTATLKADYVRGGFVFASGSQITFFEDGRVAMGVLKQEVSDGRYTYTSGPISFHPSGAVSSAVLKSGLTDANLNIPIPGTVSLDGAGRVTAFTPISGAAYRVLDRTLQFNMAVEFDVTAGYYRLVSGTAGQPQLVARVVMKFDEYGIPIQSTPIVAPAGTAFNFIKVAGAPADLYGRWFIKGFTLNGVSFGPTPVVWVRDMNIQMVEVSSQVTIGSVTYQGGQRVVIDRRGGLIPPR